MIFSYKILWVFQDNFDTKNTITFSHKIPWLFQDILETKTNMTFSYKILWDFQYFQDQIMKVITTSVSLVIIKGINMHIVFALRRSYIHCKIPCIEFPTISVIIYKIQGLSQATRIPACKWQMHQT